MSFRFPNIFFSFSPVGISPSVCSFSSSSEFVMIGLYPFFFRMCPDFPFRNTFLRRFRLFRSLSPTPIFVFDFEGFSVCHSVYLAVSHSTECIFRSSPRRQCRFFGVIIFPICGARSCFFSV